MHPEAFPALACFESSNRKVTDFGRYFLVWRVAVSMVVVQRGI